MKKNSYKITTTIIFLTITSLALLACNSDEATPTPEPLVNFLDEATTLIEEQEYSQALVVLEQAAETHPQSPMPLIQVGQIYLQQQQIKPAEDAFNRALARDLQNPIATIGLAETYLRQGNLLRARSLWQDAVELDPDLPGAFTGLGRVHLVRLEFDKAAEAFREQLAHHPDDEAEWYLATLELPSDIAVAREHLGAISTDVSADLAARRDYVAAILEPFEADASQSEIAQAAGIAMVQIEAWPLAIHALQLAGQIDDQPDQEKAETLAFLGHALAQYNRPAIEIFQQAEEIDPTSALPAYFQGIYLRQKNALNVAEDYLQRAATLDPDNPAIYIELARVKTDQGNLTAAEEYYMIAVEVAPDDLAIQTLQAKFYADRAYRLETAGIPAAEALVEIDEDNAELYDLLGWMQFLVGDLDNSETNLRQAIEIDPELMSARYHLARFLEAQNQLTDAEQEYQLITERDATDTYRPLAWEGIYRIRDRLEGVGN